MAAVHPDLLSVGKYCCRAVIAAQARRPVAGATRCVAILSTWSPAGCRFLELIVRELGLFRAVRAHDVDIAVSLRVGGMQDDLVFVAAARAAERNPCAIAGPGQMALV